MNLNLRRALVVLSLVGLTNAEAARASGHCEVKAVNANSELELVGSFELTAVNPSGHYGLFLKGAGYGFDLRITTDQCPGDVGCHSEDFGTTKEVISLVTTNLENGALTTQTLSGRQFRHGDPMTNSLSSNSTTVTCVIDGSKP